jgi:8-oxo-dGTP pyrophosphatase MutT (NUDIX family)
MDPGEAFVQTLRRELKEEIGVDYTGEPRQLGAVLSSVRITVGDMRVPLVLIPYEVLLPVDAKIAMSPEDHHEGLDWFEPKEAAELLAVKYTPDFCIIVAAL